MLKTRPTFKKPQSTPKKVSNSEKQNLQNTKPVSFNTKGYFSPDQPFNEDYLKVKLEVFKKYRDTNQQLVVLDKKDIHPGAFIQRGMVNPISNTVKVQPLGLKNMNNQQKVLNSFVKNYMNRKQKKERIDERKYAPSANGVLSEIRCLQPSVRDFHSCRSSRTTSKSIMQSRQSTARSIVSYQQLQ